MAIDGYNSKNGAKSLSEPITDIIYDYLYEAIASTIIMV
jgi:hypothetical protein